MLFKMASLVVFFFMLMGRAISSPMLDADFMKTLEDDLEDMKNSLKGMKSQIEQFHPEDEAITNKEALICENSRGSLSCPANHVLVIDGSRYGQTGNSNCPGTFTPNLGRCSASTAQSVIVNKCAYKETCELIVADATLGQADEIKCRGVTPAIQKQARISYHCVPKVVPATPFTTSGHCSKDLTRSQCKQYAKQEDLPYTETTGNTGTPPGCLKYVTSDRSTAIKYHGSSERIECSVNNECICEKVADEVQPAANKTVNETETAGPQSPKPSPIPPAVQGVKLECNELDMTATFDPEILPGDILNISVSNCPDDKFEVKNNSAVHVAFADCANKINQSKDTITQQNMVSVVNGVKERTKDVQRIVVYYYKLECYFDRVLKIHYGNAILIKDKEENFEQARKTQFAAKMEMFTSGEFNTLSAVPYQVTAFAPIYIQIEGIHNNKLFKFITTSCYATPDSNANNRKNYLFFDEKCGIDNTFKELHHNTVNKYMFKVDAFTFIKMKKQVYFHCDLLICKKESNSDECTQECKSGKRRRRRSADPDKGIESITVGSGKMTLNDHIYDRPLEDQLENVKENLASIIEKIKKQ